MLSVALVLSSLASIPLLKLENDLLDIAEVKSAVFEDRRASASFLRFMDLRASVLAPISVEDCLSSGTLTVNDAGSEIHLSSTDLASLLPNVPKGN